MAPNPFASIKKHYNNQVEPISGLNWGRNATTHTPQQPSMVLDHPPDTGIVPTNAYYYSSPPKSLTHDTALYLTDPDTGLKIARAHLGGALFAYELATHTALRGKSPEHGKMYHYTRSVFSKLGRLRVHPETLAAYFSGTAESHLDAMLAAQQEDWHSRPDTPPQIYTVGNLIDVTGMKLGERDNALWRKEARLQLQVALAEIPADSTRPYDFDQSILICVREELGPKLLPGGVAQEEEKGAKINPRQHNPRPALAKLLGLIMRNGLCEQIPHIIYDLMDGDDLQHKINTFLEYIAFSLSDFWKTYHNSCCNCYDLSVTPKSLLEAEAMYRHFLPRGSDLFQEKRHNVLFEQLKNMVVQSRLEGKKPPALSSVEFFQYQLRQQYNGKVLKKQYQSELMSMWPLMANHNTEKNKNDDNNNNNDTKNTTNPLLLLVPNTKHGNNINNDNNDHPLLAPDDYLALIPEPRCDFDVDNNYDNPSDNDGNNDENDNNNQQDPEAAIAPAAPPARTTHNTDQLPIEATTTPPPFLTLDNTQQSMNPHPSVALDAAKLQPPLPPLTPPSDMTIQRARERRLKKLELDKKKYEKALLSQATCDNHDNDTQYNELSDNTHDSPAPIGKVVSICTTVERREFYSSPRFDADSEAYYKLKGKDYWDAWQSFASKVPGIVKCPFWSFTPLPDAELPPLED